MEVNFCLGHISHEQFFGIVKKNSVNILKLSLGMFFFWFSNKLEKEYHW